jgi:putative transposase
MSNPFTFKPGVCYKLQGAVYEVCDILSDGFTVVKNLVTQQVLSQHTQDLWHHWKEGDWRFALQGNVVQEGTVQTALIHQAAEQAIQLTYPNQRVELDQVTLDLLVVDDADGLPLGRPILSGIRDQYSVYPSGITIGFGPPSSRSVLECMAYAFLEKGHLKQVIQTSNDYLACGIPDVLVVDTAMEVDRDLACACLQFGIELQQEPIAKPWLKEAIESWKATCTSDLTPVTLGALFSNFLERGGYNPVNHACITLHALWETLHRWIVDRYTQQVQTGIGGDCDGNGIPSKLWQHALEHGFAPHLPPSCDDLFALLLHDEKRTLQHGGIIFEAISYRSRELALLQRSLTYSNAGTSVQVFYHPGELSRVWVRDRALSVSTRP